MENKWFLTFCCDGCGRGVSENEEPQITIFCPECAHKSEPPPIKAENSIWKQLATCLHDFRRTHEKDPTHILVRDDQMVSILNYLQLVSGIEICGEGEPGSPERAIVMKYRGISIKPATFAVAYRVTEQDKFPLPVSQ